MIAKIILKYIIAILALALVMPAGIGQSKANFPQALSENSEKTVSAQTMLRVVTAAAPQVVVAAASGISSVTGLGCLAGSATAVFDDVQSPAAVNLNQPASCFNLRIAAIQPAKSLTVQPLLQPAVTVSVSITGISLNLFNLFPDSANKQATAALILVVAFLALAIEIKRTRSTTESPSVKTAFTFRPSLAQLVMLRC